MPVVMPPRLTGAWLNGLSPEERIEVLRGSFGQRMHAWAASHVTFFWWARRSLFGRSIVRNGSVFFLIIGERLFAVTAAHVYHGFLAAKAKAGGRIVCRIGNVLFDPEARLHGLREGIDIATFDFTYDELAKTGKQAIVVSPDAWPPPHPFSEQAAILAGFPGASRLWLDPRSISFGLTIGMQPINIASDRSITCPFEREYWVDTTDHGLIPKGFDLGGISGGPLLLPMEVDGCWHMQLGGVISEAPSKDIETVVSVPAHFIAADGTINDERSAPVRHAIRAGGPNAG